MVDQERERNSTLTSKVEQLSSRVYILEEVYYESLLQFTAIYIFFKRRVFPPYILVTQLYFFFYNEATRAN